MARVASLILFLVSVSGLSALAAHADTSSPYLSPALQEKEITAILADSAVLAETLESGNLLKFLDLNDPEYFQDQFTFLLNGADTSRNPAEVMDQYICEFLAICDINRQFKLADIAVVTVFDIDERTDLKTIQLALIMRSGLQTTATVFYNSKSRKFFASVG